MQELIFKPELHIFDTFGEFVKEFQIGEEDLIITNEFILENYGKRDELKADVIYQERYGVGEPTDEMFEAMEQDIAKMKQHKRIIGIGGGTVIDISKIFALKNYHPIADLYDRKIEIEKDKELILIPTTCGTGSEVTNISILAFLKRNTKIGLATDELYADKAVLVPEFLEKLPFRFFAASSVDALIHAVESSLSPRSTVYTELFGYKAIEMILKGYMEIAENGEEARYARLKDFLIASNFAGLAFGTAGCGPVHALSYPLGGTFHVAHGESNYAVFMGVIKKYLREEENAKLLKLQNYMASILGCGAERVFDQLEKLLNKIIEKKSLCEYGATREMIAQWAQSVMDSQQRLMKNSPMPLNYEDVLEIYETIYE